MKLAAAAVQVWQANLDLPPAMLETLRGTLSASELARAARFYFQPDRDRFTAAHAILRDLLSGYLRASPAALEFATNAYGKPALDGIWRDALHFNLSHSGALVVVAIAPDREVGVDVEQYLPARGNLAVAECYFSSAEVARLRALPLALRARGFLNCWTRKEAYIKAIGRGLSIPLDSFDVSLAPAEPAALLRPSAAAEGRIWQLRHLDLGAQYLGALAAAGTGWRFDRHCWSGPGAAARA